MAPLARTVHTMKRSMLQTPGTGLLRTRRSRGAQLLEFAITLPIFLFMLLFSLDMGRMVFLSGVVHDAAFTSARAGAQVGAAGTNASGASRTAFYEAVDAIPGSKNEDATFQVVSSNECTSSGRDEDTFVEVRVSYKVRFITPGLNSMLGVMSDRDNGDGSWTLPATGVARCEIVRS